MKKEKEKGLGLYLGIATLLFFLWLAFLLEPVISGQPYNQTALVNTTVNITNAAPLVLSVSAPTPINLEAYGNVIVQCNATIYDFDNNTDRVNATFHLATVSPEIGIDRNYLYQNSSCTRQTPQDYYTNYSCTFTISYFANNGTWRCNVTGIDIANATGTNSSNQAVINPLVAIKMDSLLDFGEVSVNQASNDTVANITNAGNRNANISVKGYGLTENDGLAMVCQSGSIQVENERYDVYPESDFGFMLPLSSSDAMISNFFIPQRTSETAESVNSTYWKIFIPPGAGGVCNGKILFTASDRGI